jgi:hypothetical protein
MAYKVERLLVPSWRNVDIGLGLFTYTFIFRVSSKDNLPPADYCDLISKFARIISKNHSTACIWVQVEAPGLWFPLEIRRGLRKSRVPIAVTRTNSRLILADFNVKPWTSGVPLPPPPFEPDWAMPVSENELTCLRVLARLKYGLTSEIASLAGFSRRTCLDSLNALKKDYVYHVFPSERTNPERVYSSKYSYWGLKKLGLIAALRSWGVPPGVRFSSRLEPTHGEESRHRVTARLWRASLQKDLGASGEIWSGWSEVNLPDMRLTPDALAWGKLDDRETLFWLEVESGHLSTDNVLAKISKRFRGATKYARDREVNLVFGVLAMPWVQNAIKLAFLDMEPNVAVIVGDWKEFGKLPVIQWGMVRTMED